MWTAASCPAERRRFEQGVKASAVIARWCGRRVAWRVPEVREWRVRMPVEEPVARWVLEEVIDVGDGVGDA